MMDKSKAAPQYKNDKYSQMLSNLSHIINQNNSLYQQIQMIKKEHTSSLKSYIKNVKAAKMSMNEKDNSETYEDEFLPIT